MQPFTISVIGILRSIPEGKVMTYGQVARAAGSPRAARQVVRVLHTLSGKYDLPWHRVVNKSGEIALQDDISRSVQQSLLEVEGVHFDTAGCVDLERYQWDET